MGSRPLLVSAVIRALNEEEHIGRLLTGLSRQSRPVDEIVLVDSGSRDATVEIARRFGARVVRISPHEFTFGRSLNQGMECSRGEVIVIPSAHVYPLHDNWVESLIEPFLEDEKIALTYGRQVGGATTKYSERRLMAQWFPETSDHNQTHPFSNNANAAVRREVWERFRYDESLTGLEDLDFARRALEGGWKVAYVAQAVVAHVHDEGWRQVRDRYRREAIAHRRIFHEQRMSLAEAVKLIALNIGRDASDAAREGLLASHIVEIVAFRLAQFFGTYQGFRQQGPVTAELKRRFYYPRAGSKPRPDIRAVGGAPIDYGAPETAERWERE